MGILVTVVSVLLGTLHLATNGVGATCESTQALIVGAGPSGIGAARTFHANSVSNFVVLEANDYIGGRVKNVMFGGVSVELGAQWSHGTQTNHSVWQLIHKYNLTVHADNYDYLAFRNASSGDAIDSTDAGNRLQAAVVRTSTIMAARAENSEGDVPLSVGLQFGGWMPRTNIERAVEYFTFPFSAAALPTKISATFYAHADDGEGVDYIVTDTRGYNYVFEKEAESFMSKIKLNTAVTKISKLADGKYKVDTSNNTCYHSDHVLLTVSSGVLSSNMITFDPDLPQWKKDALAFVPMGHFCKNFLQFNDTYWGDEYYIVLVGNDPSQYSILQNTNRPTMYADKHILIVMTIDDKCHQDLLRTDQEVQNDIMAVLRTITPTLPDPIGFIRNSWGVNERFLGSYSYVAAGVGANEMKAATHPVGHIWFSGEYTAEDNHGNVQGAYNTGVAQANRMMSCVEDSTSCPGEFKKDDICPASVTPSAAAIKIPFTLTNTVLLVIMVVFWMQ